MPVPMPGDGTDSDDGDYLTIIVYDDAMMLTIGCVWGDHSMPTGFKDMIKGMINQHISSIETEVNTILNDNSPWHVIGNQGIIEEKNNLKDMYKGLLKDVADDPPNPNFGTLKALSSPRALALMKRGSNPLRQKAARIEALIGGIIDANECAWGARIIGDDNLFGTYIETCKKLIEEFAQIPLVTCTEIV